MFITPVILLTSSLASIQAWLSERLLDAFKSAVLPSKILTFIEQSVFADTCTQHPLTRNQTLSVDHGFPKHPFSQSMWCATERNSMPP
jgi:hypothetical protein